MTIRRTGPSANGDGKPAPQPVYSSVERWVTSHFLPMFRRPLGGEYRWCAQWWRHAEAITRLTALWHTWEALAPARHRDGHLAARPPGPPAPGPARQDRAVLDVLRRRAHRPRQATTGSRRRAGGTSPPAGHGAS